jgi:hypothetical protein
MGAYNPVKGYPARPLDHPHSLSEAAHLSCDHPPKPIACAEQSDPEPVVFASDPDGGCVRFNLGA